MTNRTILQPKNVQQYIIGIDTGGTFTDAALLDNETGTVIATAKYTTIHYQLSKTTGEDPAALLAASGAAPPQIRAVAVLSTPAANSGVKNKGPGLPLSSSVM